MSLIMSRKRLISLLLRIFRMSSQSSAPTCGSTICTAYPSPCQETSSSRRRLTTWACHGSICGRVTSAGHHSQVVVGVSDQHTPSPLLRDCPLEHLTSLIGLRPGLGHPVEFGWQPGRTAEVNPVDHRGHLPGEWLEGRRPRDGRVSLENRRHVLRRHTWDILTAYREAERMLLSLTATNGSLPVRRVAWRPVLDDA